MQEIIFSCYKSCSHIYR